MVFLARALTTSGYLMLWGYRVGKKLSYCVMNCVMGGSADCRKSFIGSVRLNEVI